MRIIAGQFKGRTLKAPSSDKTRPSSELLRGALFNICQQEIENSVFLDLFAGSGAIAFEALSRGASSVVLVEKDKEALKAIRANQESLKVSITLLGLDASVALEKLQGRLFDIIFMDPPYKTSVEPFIAKCSTLLKPNGHLFVEDKETKEVPEGPLQLKSCRRFGSSRLRHYIKS